MGNEGFWIAGFSALFGFVWAIERQKNDLTFPQLVAVLLANMGISLLVVVANDPPSASGFVFTATMATGATVIGALIGAGLGAVIAHKPSKPAQPASTPPPPSKGSIDLPFSSNIGFFDYQCKFGNTALHDGNYVVAIVQDARIEVGAQRSVKVEKDGNQLAMIKVAAEDGGFSTPSITQNPGPALAPGDLVLWQLGILLDTPSANDPRSRWVGLIIAKIAPVIAADGMHRILADYRKH